MESFLTELQRKILELRARNMTQEEIAKIMGTTKANISIIEKRARKNIEKAMNTISIWEEINSILSIHVHSGTDLFNIPDFIYREGDRMGIKVPLTTVEIISSIAERAGEVVENRVLKTPIKVFITRDNRIGVRILEHDEE